MKYRPEIDGLRALAVVPVILFHAGFAGFEGGFVGVDIFFVISGYLITGIIADELDRGRFSILNFYERRARRIIPAIMVVIAASLVIGWFAMLPHQYEAFSKSVLSMMVFGSNVFFWWTDDYFGTASELKPMLHTWSLAVEEQYYLLFPVLLAMFWKTGRRRIVTALIVIGSVSLVASEIAARTIPSAAFFLTPFRVWELLAGALIALAAAPRAGKHADGFALLGLVLIALSIVLYDATTPFPGLAALLPVGGTALVIHFARSGGIAARFLSWPVFVGIGLVSYSAYLWHQPLFAFARVWQGTEPSHAAFVALIVLTFILAGLSWRFIEQPFRRKPVPLLASQTRVFAATIASGFVLGAIALTIDQTDGVEARLTAEQREVMAYRQYDRNKVYRSGQCLLSQKQGTDDFAPNCRTRDEDVLIIGDSHAAALASGFRDLGTLKVGQLTGAGCPTSLDFADRYRTSCAEFNDYVLGEIAKTPPKALYVHANWALYDPSALDALEPALDRIAEIGGIPVTIVGVAPQFQPSLPEVILVARKKVEPNLELDADLGELRAINARLEAIASARGLAFFDPLPTFCDGSVCKVTLQTERGVLPITWDYGHLTAEGAALVARDILAAAR